MPTGYTSGVQEGKITELSDFAWTCARNFGALLSMRDDPMGAVIPQSLEPDISSYDKRLEDANKRLELLASMSLDNIELEAKLSYAEDIIRYRERCSRREIEAKRYNDMIAKVEAWDVPQPLAGLRKFMLDQLHKSLEFDCDGTYDTPPKGKTVSEWLEEEMEDCVRTISSASEGRTKEIARTINNNKWLDTLREALENNE